MSPLTVSRWDEGTPIWNRPVEPGELEALARTDVAPLQRRMDELLVMAREEERSQLHSRIVNQRTNIADQIEAVKAARVSLEYTARQRLRNHENRIQRLPDYEVTATKELLAELTEEKEHVR